MALRTLDYTILIVEELDRSIAFYTEALGIPLRHRATEYAQLATENTRLALYTRAAMARTLNRPLERAAANAPGFEIGFLVDDVEIAFEALTAAGAEPIQAPTTRDWGQRTAYVSDPDGHLIELAQSVEARGAP